MKSLLTCLLTMMAVHVGWAQQSEMEIRRKFPGSKSPARKEMHHLRFAKHILSERCVREARISPEQVKKLRKEFALIDSRMQEFGRKIGENARKQAEIAVNVLTVPGSDPIEMIQLTEEIGRLRTEQAKLSVQVLIVIRDNLEAQQCAKVVEIMREEREKVKRRVEFLRKRRAKGEEE